MNYPVVLALSAYSRKPYARTDRLYSLEGRGADPEGGLDVIDSRSGERQFLTAVRNAEVEQAIRDSMGPRSVLRYAGQVEDIHRYHVPRGAMPLLRVLETSTFGEQYMRHIMDQARDILDSLRAIRPDGFGITLEQLAIAYDASAAEDEDPSYLTIVPPLVGSAERYE